MDNMQPDKDSTLHNTRFYQTNQSIFLRIPMALVRKYGFKRTQKAKIREKAEGEGFVLSFWKEEEDNKGTDA